MEKIKLYSSNVTISEDENQSDILNAKFIISDFSTNKNGVQLNRDSINDWLSTLVNKPLVGKIKSGLIKDDFTGHNVSVVKVKDEDGQEHNEYVFDTSAFGTFTSANIETIDNHEYITAQCKIWKRFTKACKIIVSRVKEGTLHTSWEIDVSKYHMVGNTKVIDEGCFEAHTLLGEDVEPAYDCSGLLSVASKEEDSLSEALKQDLITSQEDVLDKQNKVEKGENTLEQENIEATKEENQKEPLIASLTLDDIMEKLHKLCEYKGYIVRIYPEEHRLILHKWEEKQDNFYETTYKVENNEVSLIGEPIAKTLEFVDIASIEESKTSIKEKNEQISTLTSEKEELNKKVESLGKDISDRETALATASEEKSTLDKTIDDLQGKIKELSTYKEELDKINAEKKANELAQKQNQLREAAISSKLFSSEELSVEGEIGKIIEIADEDGLIRAIGKKNMERLLSQKRQPETSENKSVKTKVSLESDNTVCDYASMMSKWLKK